MDFLKKHHEKIILALALLVLIGTAGYLALRVGALTKLVQDSAQQTQNKGENIRPIDPNAYKQALTALESPFSWSYPASNTFGIAPLPEKPPTNDGPVVTPSPLELLQVQTKQFKLLFRAYNWDREAGTGRNFQLSSKSRTYFINEIGQPIPDPSETNKFTVSKFQRKIIEVDVPGIGKQERDASELTLTRADEEPITLVLDRVSAPNPVALIRCRRRPEEPVLVKQGDTFDCAGVAYKVVDITSTQVLILNPRTGEEVTLKLLSTAP